MINEDFDWWKVFWNWIWKIFFCVVGLWFFFGLESNRETNRWTNDTCSQDFRSINLARQSRKSCSKGEKVKKVVHSLSSLSESVVCSAPFSVRSILNVDNVRLSYTNSKVLNRSNSKYRRACLTRPCQRQCLVELILVKSETLHFYILGCSVLRSWEKLFHKTKIK